MTARWLRGLFALFQPRPSHFERIIVATLKELQEAVANLQAELQTATAANQTLVVKVDALIVLTDTIKDQLVQLTEGGLLPPDALSSLTMAINDSITQIHAIGTADTAESFKVDTTTARDQLPPDDTGATQADGTPPADGAASTEGSGDAPQDGTSTDTSTTT